MKTNVLFNRLEWYMSFAKAYTDFHNCIWLHETSYRVSKEVRRQMEQKEREIERRTKNENTKEVPMKLTNGSYEGSFKPVKLNFNLRELSAFLNDRVGIFLDRLATVGAPPPDFQNPFPDPVKDNAARNATFEIVRACERIMALVLGPVEWGMYQNMAFVDPACISVMLQLGIPEKVAPGPEPTSLHELMRLTGASKDVLSGYMNGFQCCVL